MKKTLLTIDWDYFIDAPLEVRDNIFPRITEGFRDSIPDNSLWKNVKSKTYDFDMDSFERLYSAFHRCGHTSDHPISLYASENHCEAYYVAKTIGAESVFNVDYHHDMGISSRMSCDSWARALKSENPEIEYHWCKRDDSVTTCFGEEVEYHPSIFEEILHIVSMGHIHAVHLCRSDLYSPPVYDNMFSTLLVGIHDSLNSPINRVGDQSLEVRRKFI